MDFTKLTATLEKLGYQVSLFPTAAQAADYLNEQIDGCSVGIGGSVTLRDMGMYELLSSLTGREKVEALLDKSTPGGKFTLTEYPRGEKALLALRAKVNTLLRNALKKKK